jgi:hypothetical protein
MRDQPCRIGHSLAMLRDSIGIDMNALIIPSLMLLFAAVSVRAAGDEIVVGVLSPTGVNRAIGTAHEQSIRIAFDRLGPTIQGGPIAIPVRVDYRSDQGDPDVAVAQAKELKDEGVIAILGPVDSNSTESVLEAELGVPVLSALSTAPSLSKQRDRWFFRLTLSDDERVGQFVDWLQRYDGMMPEPRLVLYDGGQYGEGLRDAFMKGLGLPAETAMSWSDFVTGGVSSEATREEVRKGQGFAPAGVALLDPPPGVVFVLGPNTGAVAIAQGISAFLRTRGSKSFPQYYFVGADSDLERGAPPGSITIGEPTIIDSDGTDVSKIRKEFADRSRLNPESLVVTAYEAAYNVLPRAIAAAIQESARNNVQITELREKLRAELESLEFQSIEPWRRIHLRNGALSGAPSVPIYRIAPRLNLIEVPIPQPWLDVEMPQTIGLLEGPVKLRVTPKRLDGEVPAQVLRGAEAPFEIIPSEKHSLPDGRAELTFYPLWPGTYHLDTRLPTNPVQASTVVAFGGGYPMALFGAALGSLLVVYAATERHEKVSRRRICFGILTGLILAFLAFNRDLLPGGFPLPTFSSSPSWNALWLGLAGGWFGPGVLLLLVGSLLRGIGELFGQTSSYPPKPSTPPSPTAG